MVVDKSAGWRVAEHDAGAEPGRGRDEQGGGDGDRLFHHGRAVELRDRHIAHEAISVAGHRLNELGVNTQGEADLANREVDVLVVLDHGVRPELFLNLIACHNLAGVLDEKRKKTRRLGLQQAWLAVPAQ